MKSEINEEASFHYTVNFFLQTAENSKKFLNKYCNRTWIKRSDYCVARAREPYPDPYRIVPLPAAYGLGPVVILGMKHAQWIQDVFSLSISMNSWWKWYRRCAMKERVSQAYLNVYISSVQFFLTTSWLMTMAEW